MKPRLTSARKAILELLEAEDTHLSALELHAALKERLPSINLSTVYRSMDYLVEKGFISVSDIGTGSPVYEILQDDIHHHIVCEQCGTIEDIAHEVIAPLFETIHNETNYKLTTNHLVIFGVCSSCQESK